MKSKPYAPKGKSFPSKGKSFASRGKSFVSKDKTYTAKDKDRKGVSSEASPWSGKVRKEPTRKDSRRSGSFPERGQRVSKTTSPYKSTRPERTSPQTLAARAVRSPAARRAALRKDTPPPKHVVGPNAILMWGLHAVEAAWMNPKRKIHRVWLTESGQKLLASTQSKAREELLVRPDAKQIDRLEMDRLTPPNSVHQGIVIEVGGMPEPSLHDILAGDNPPDLLLVLDQVTDPHNVGAILRSAAALGAGALILTERNAPAATGVLAKSASGALEHVPMVHVVNLARSLEDLRHAGYWCVGLAEEGAKDLAELDMSGRTALVLGAEGDGLRHLTRQKCDELARLPTGGAIGSLNVSNAAAVALYEARRQRKAK